MPVEETIIEVFSEENIYRLVVTALIWAALFIIYKVLSKLLDRFRSGIRISARHRVYGLTLREHYLRYIERIVSILLFVAGVLLVMDVWGLTGMLQGVLVGAGLMTVIIGFAAQGILSDLTAGVFMYVDHPFNMGDWVMIGELEGTVVDISTRATRIRSYDGEYITIPNRKMAESVIINKNRYRNLRLKTEIGIDFTSDIDKAMELAMEVLRANEDIIEHPEPTIIVTEVGESSIKLELRFWVKRITRPESMRIRTEVIRDVKKSWDKKGVKIPFPHRELIHLNKK